MTEKKITDKQLLDSIVGGIQERKGKKIVIVDMNNLRERACNYFVICEGDSTTQVAAIADSVKDFVREQIKVKPLAVDGMENAVWVAMDYAQALVHIFHRDTRLFYDLEHLWLDAKLITVPDLQ